MKQIAVLLSILIILIVGISTHYFYTMAADSVTTTAVSKTIAVPKNRTNKTNPAERPIAKAGQYEAYVDGVFRKDFFDFDDAVAFAEQYPNAFVVQKNQTEWLWDNYLSFTVFTTTSSDTQVEFATFAEAVNYARTFSRATIYHRKDNSLIWSNIDPLPAAKMILNVPHVMQLPELPRGCEVTSLTMLLNYKGVKKTKMELADEIKKDTTPYQVKGGKIYYGNPNNGFIGDMLSLDTRGLGVYHAPIFELMQVYLADSAVDLTGCEFEDMLQFVVANAPVWIITNATYAKLSDSYFTTWHTPDGEIKITNKEHSVLVTGFDEKYIYFNDPLGGRAFAEKVQFKEAWEQMGQQAVSVSH